MQHLSADARFVMEANVVKEPSAELRKKTLEVERVLRSALGSPAMESTGESPLDVLIGTILSQNTNDVNSHKAWVNLKKTFHTWDDLLAAPPKKVAKAIEVGGLKNQKAAAIRSVLRALKKRTGRYSLGYLRGMSDVEALGHLQEFSGVGAKTAACVLVFGFGREIFPVDTHIHRILNRLGVVRTKSPEKTFEAMQQLTPRGTAYPFHVNLIRFGRQTCQARTPRCGQCVLYDLCEYPMKDDFFRKQSTPDTAPEKRDFIILHNLKRRPGRRLVDSARKKP
jgi:endonuclease III